MFCLPRPFFWTLLCKDVVCEQAQIDIKLSLRNSQSNLKFNHQLNFPSNLLKFLEKTTQFRSKTLLFIAQLQFLHHLTLWKHPRSFVPFPHSMLLHQMSLECFPFLGGEGAKFAAHLLLSSMVDVHDVEFQAICGRNQNEFVSMDLQSNFIYQNSGILCRSREIRRRIAWQ
jgi:hypothetical protein